MTAECPFCRLISRSPASVVPHLVYEDGLCFVLLDRQSLHWGHCMVIPKHHVREVHELAEEEYVSLFLLARHLAASLREATGARAVGYVAFGSGLPHAHVHLVPHDDPKVLIEPHNHLRHLSEDELADNAARLHPHLAQLAARTTQRQR